MKRRRRRIADPAAKIIMVVVKDFEFCKASMNGQHKRLGSGRTRKRQAISVQELMASTSRSRMKVQPSFYRGERRDLIVFQIAVARDLSVRFHDYSIPDRCSLDVFTNYLVFCFLQTRFYGTPALR
jgi:hypothetical protein